MWTLKDKLYEIKLGGDGVKVVSVSNPKRSIMWDTVYKSSDIETLRKKLMAELSFDFDDEAIKKVKSSELCTTINEHVRKVINRRFGHGR